MSASQLCNADQFNNIIVPEMLLRHLLEHLDGSTTGLRSFFGHIGKALSICQNMSVVAFEKIATALPTVDLTSQH